MLKKIIILIIILSVESCAVQDNRILRIENEFGIKLPKCYKLIEYSTYGSEIEMNLEFDKNCFEKLINVLKPANKYLVFISKGSQLYSRDLEDNKNVTLEINLVDRSLNYRLY